MFLVHHLLVIHEESSWFVAGGGDFFFADDSLNVQTKDALEIVSARHSIVATCDVVIELVGQLEDANKLLVPGAFYGETVYLCVSRIQFSQRNRLVRKHLHVANEFLAFALKTNVNQLAAKPFVCFLRLNVVHNK